MPAVAAVDAADQKVVDEASSSGDDVSRRKSKGSKSAKAIADSALAASDDDEETKAEKLATVFDASKDNVIAIEMFVTESGSPDNVLKRPHELLVSLAHDALCDVRRQVSKQLISLVAHDLAWNKAMLDRMPPRAQIEKALSDGGRSALTRAECELLVVLQKAVAMQRLAVLRRFKDLYNVESAPAGSLASNIDTLEELLESKKARHALLREAVLESTESYHRHLAPFSGSLSCLSSSKGFCRICFSKEREREENVLQTALH